MSKKTKKNFNFWKEALIIGFVLMVALFIFSFVQGFFSFQNEVDPQSLTGNFDSNAKVAIFNNNKMFLSSDNPLDNVSEIAILGNSTDEEENTTNNNLEKTIKVDLTGQRLFMYEGDKVVDYFMISSGKWGKTPTGEFTIWAKFRYSKMSGGSRALHTYYYLPNVPYVMYFHNDEVPASKGFGIHGTYWHDNFGQPMSHGCINMRTEDAKKVYEWAMPQMEEDDNSARASKDNPGTKIIIFGEAQLY